MDYKGRPPPLRLQPNPNGTPNGWRLRPSTTSDNYLDTLDPAKLNCMPPKETKQDITANASASYNVHRDLIYLLHTTYSISRHDGAFRCQENQLSWIDRCH